MGTVPFPLLAFAGLSDTTLDLINEVGWFLPFLALIIPITLVLLFAYGHLGYLLFAVAQAASIVCGLGIVKSYLRRQGFTSYQVKITIGPCYLIACFATNIITLIGFGIIRKFF